MYAQCEVYIVCKEGIRIGRKTDSQSYPSTGMNGSPVQMFAGRAERTAVSVVVTDTSDPTASPVYIGWMDGGTFSILTCVSPADRSAYLTVEQYGSRLLGPLYLLSQSPGAFPSAAWTEYFLYQELSQI